MAWSTYVAITIFFINRVMAEKITLFDQSNFQGRTLPLMESVCNFATIGINFEVGSVLAELGTWRLYDDINFTGNFIQVSPDSTPSCRITVRICSVQLMSAQIILFEHADFTGNSLPLTRSDPLLSTSGFNNLTSTVIVLSGNWKLYKGNNFEGESALFIPGSYS